MQCRSWSWVKQTVNFPPEGIHSKAHSQTTIWLREGILSLQKHPFQSGGMNDDTTIHLVASYCLWGNGKCSSIGMWIIHSIHFCTHTCSTSEVKTVNSPVGTFLFQMLLVNHKKLRQTQVKHTAYLVPGICYPLDNAVLYFCQKLHINQRVYSFWRA